MGTYLFLALVILGWITLDPSVAAESHKRALVVGNGAYQYVEQLPNPPRDAQSIAEALRGIGFGVTLSEDAGMSDFMGALNGFVASLGDADTALFYYAGHGISVDGQNYLVPVDARVRTAADLKANLIALNSIIETLVAGPGRATLFILDACRDDPFANIPGGRSLSFGRGLSEVYLNKSSLDVSPDGSKRTGQHFASGTLIAFATGPGTIARDGEGDHSPFTMALLKYLSTPGLEVNSLFNKVRQDVFSSTKGEQLPWSQSAMVGDLYLAGRARSEPSAAPNTGYRTQLPPP